MHALISSFGKLRVRTSSNKSCSVLIYECFEVPRELDILFGLLI